MSTLPRDHLDVSCDSPFAMRGPPQPDQPDEPDAADLVTRALEHGEHPSGSALRAVRAAESLEDARLYAATRSRLFGLPPPSLEIGRFTVLERLGAGAMGEVYAAYDDRLDRKVALKLMHAMGGEGSPRAHERMLREAQVLARVSHPNIVQVFEVGTFEGRVFIAMEFIRGRTLRGWLAEHPRSWREILGRYLEAGRGLAAAHEASLVHRDFKPDNVLVGDDGRVRVVDFGLARATSAAQQHTQEHGSAASSDSAIAASTMVDAGQMSLTETGAVLGTPAYMSAEQFLGREVGPRSDQFGFCVALYEGLYGRRPFVGRHFHQIAVNVIAGACEPPPRSSGVPPWIWQILRRGLARDPEERFPSMTALLAALERDPARRRRRVAGAGVLMGLGLGVGLAMDGLAPEQPDPCETATPLLDGAWDGTQRQRLDEAFAATGLGYAEQTRDRVEASLDAYAGAWLEAHRDACEATHIHRTQSEAMLDLRMGCLLGRRERLAALTDRLAQAGPAEVTHAIAALAELPSLEPCRDPELLRQVVRPPEDPAVASAVADLRPRLAQLLALEATGQYRQALPLAQQAVDDSAALGYPPIEAEARFVLGKLSAELGHAARAEAELLQAVDLAEGSRHDEQAAEAWLELARMGLEDLSDPTPSRRWLARARAAVTRLGDHGPRRAQWIAQQAVLLVLEGRPEQAIDEFQRALSELEQHPNTEVVRARRLQSLANAQEAASRFDEAAATYERAQRLLFEALGSRHPDVGDMAYDRGTFLVNRSELEAAREQLELASSIWREAFGDVHYKVGLAELALAKLDVTEGDLAAARRHALRAGEIYALTLEPSHPERAAPDINLGVILFFEQDYQGALEAYRRGLVGLRRALPPGHVDIGIALGNIGEALLALDRLEEAGRAFDEAELIVHALPERDPQVLSLVLKGQGQVQLRLGRPDAAVALLTQALRVREQSVADPLELADVRWSLAQAYGSDPRARGLAQAALQAYAELGPAGQARREEIEQWMERFTDHPPKPEEQTPWPPSTPPAPSP
jgi:eukaryotic-like serine/threonine-protein kinase